MSASKAIDSVCMQLIELCKARGMGRFVLTVREDGRINLRADDARGFSKWWMECEVDSEMPRCMHSPSQALAMFAEGREHLPRPRYEDDADELEATS